jgi:hypothetical protein
LGGKMQAEGILIGLAEVAIALAGFSGIVVVLDRGDHPWSDLDRLRLSMLLQVSISCVFLSFLPIFLTIAGVQSASVWSWSSALWLAYMVIVLGYRARSSVSLRGNPDVDLSVKLVLAFMMTTLAIAVLVQLANVAWLRSPWPHVLAVLQGLLIGCVFFVRLLRRIVTPTA